MNDDQRETQRLDDDTIPERWQLSSLCMQCGKQGTTNCLVRDIPFFHKVICMSFDCPHCGNHNNEVTSASDIEPRGIRWILHVSTEQDWLRQVWISGYATVRIPKIELEIPPPATSCCSPTSHQVDCSSRGAGRITTVEGIWLQVVENLQPMEKDNPTIKDYIQHRLLPLRQDVDFYIELEDPSGMSRIEWRIPQDNKEPGMILSNAEEWDKNLRMTFFIRSQEQNESLGWTSSVYNTTIERDSEEGDLNDEVVKLPSNCPCCGLPGENRIHCTDIPHFKQVLIMAFTCTHCGYKTNHIQSGLGIEEKGRKITLHCKTLDDYSRSVLLSDTCQIIIPELNLQVQGESFCKWSTVEGIVKDIADNMESRYSFLVGDSVEPEQRERWNSFLQQLNRIANNSEEGISFTFILDDPAGNCYIQNLCAPEEDPQMEIETYERTKEMNEALGYE